MGQYWPGGYSAQVEVYLLVDGERLNISQIGNGSFMLRDARIIPPSTSATLVMKIDGKEETEEIFLRDGASGKDERVAYI